MKRTTLALILLAILVASCLMLTACDIFGHSCNFGEWAVIEQPNCTEAGLKVQVCECGESRTEIIPATNHSYAPIVTAPTCTEQGFTTHTCKCGDSYVDTYVDALGHTEGAVVVENRVDATCTEDGSYDNVVYCTVCDAELSRETKTIEAGHSYSAVVTPPTCTEQGYTTHTCTCGDSYIDTYVDATGHNHSAVVTPPTCTEQGYTTHTCECGDSYIDTYVDALGHDEIEHDAQEQTCTEVGWDAYVTCSRCDYSTYNEIPATGHSHTSVVTPPTCTEQGYTTHTCHCGDTYVDTYVDALGHSHSAVVTEPTCTERGFTTHTCACGDSYVDTYVNATGVCNFQQSNTCEGCGKNIADVAVKAYDMSATADGDVMGYIVRRLDGKCDAYIKGTGAMKDYTFSNAPFDDYHIYTFVNAYIGGDITSIGEVAFSNCNGLTNVIFGEDSQLTSIGEYAFFNCKGLTNITIPDNVTSIGNHAFSRCSSLTSITIPDSVTSIENMAFSECISLTSIVVDENNPNYKSIDGNLCSKDGKTLIQYAIGKTDKSFVIPDGVTIIGDFAFYDCINLTSIDIQGVTNIGKHAFYDCISLTSFVIPDNVTSIGDSAFKDCDSIISVTFGENSQLTTIGEEAFYFCDNLTSIIIPGSVTSIGNYAFRGCSSLTSIEVDEDNLNYKSIEGNLYSKDGKTLIQYAGAKTDMSFKIPDSVTIIGDGAFYSCDSLTSVTIGNSVTNIGERAFDDCNSLTSVTIGNSVTNIGEYAFSSCLSLTMVKITNLASWCNIKFDNYTSNPLHYAKHLYLDGEKITELVIPDSVTSIGEDAFYNCKDFTSITIPEGVTSIGEGAFSNCTNLKIVYINSPTIATELTSDTACGYLIDLAWVILVEKSITSVATYVTDRFSYIEEVSCEGIDYISYSSWHAHTWGDWYETQAPTNTEAGEERRDCGDCDCYETSAIRSGMWGSNLTWKLNEATGELVISGTGEMDDFTAHSTSAWREYKDLIKSITFENGVTSIGSNAFEWCSSLASIEFPNSITSICEGAFYACSDLTSITIPDGVTIIGDYAFYACSDLTSITIPASVTSIGNQAFNFCVSLAEVYNYSSLSITKGRSDYGYVAYYALDVYTTDEPSKLTTDENGFVIHTSGNIKTLVRYIGAATEIIIPTCVTAIGSGAFNECVSLTSIEIPESVTSIGYRAFYYCTSLTSIEIPASVTTIELQAFLRCDNLTSVTFEDPNGWYTTRTKGAISGTNMPLGDASTNAENLTMYYKDYYWYKK